MTLDEVLGMLPETGLTVYRLDQWPRTGAWTCVLDDGGGCDNEVTAATPLEALLGSLNKAGFGVD